MESLAKIPRSRRAQFAAAALVALFLLPPPDLVQANQSEVDVIITYSRMPDDKERKRIDKLGGRLKRSYSRLPMLVLRVPENKLHKLPEGLGVVSVSADGEVAALMTEARPTANDPLSGSLAAFRGSGVTVAIVDSGIAPHPDLPAGIEQYSFLDGAFAGAPELLGASVPLADPLGHGTHIAGIIAGSGAASGGAYRGLATDAGLLSLRVLDGNGRGVVSDTIAALDWLLMYGAYYNVRVVNMSLGKAVETTRLPGATRSGLTTWSRSVGPRDEKVDT